MTYEGKVKVWADNLIVLNHLKFSLRRHFSSPQHCHKHSKRASGVGCCLLFDAGESSVPSLGVHSPNTSELFKLRRVKISTTKCK